MAIVETERAQPTIPSYKTKVLTPSEFRKDFYSLLPHAKRVDMLFMNASEKPLEELAGQIPTDPTFQMRFARSAHHQKFFPGGEQSPLPFYALLRHLWPKRRKRDRLQTASIKAAYAKLDSHENVTLFPTKAQGGISDKVVPFSQNIHAKEVQAVQENGSVVTYLPEFNFTQDTMNARNFALRFEESPEEAAKEKSVSSVVKDYFEKIIFKQKFKDYEQEINGTDELTFLADAGRVGRSIIRNKAKEMLKDKNTKDIFFASQFPPAGAVLREIKKQAKKDKDTAITILLSEDCQKGIEESFFQWRVKKYDSIKVVYANTKVHSKLLAVNSGIGVEETPDGKRLVQKPVVKGKPKAIFSSNNLYPASNVGTGESGFLIKDRTLINQIGEKVIEVPLLAA